MKRKIAAMVLCVMLALVYAGGEAEEKIVIQDMKGREITLDAPLTRIVALSAADCEILYALGAGECLVGRGAYCDYPEAVFDLPVVNTGAETNLEEILALNPQAVVMSIMSQTVEQVNALENAGIKVIALNSVTLEDTYQAISLLGAVTGKNQEAESMIASMQETFDALSKRVGRSGKTVYFEESPLQWGLWAAGEGTFLNDVAAICGLENIFSDLTGDQSVSEEQVIARNPDYIVTLTMYWGEGPTPVEEIEGRIGWENVEAVKMHQVMDDPDSVFARPGPRLVDAAQRLFDFVYGTEEAAPAA